MKEFKVYVPTPEISELVQKKLFEKGYVWNGSNKNSIDLTLGIKTLYVSSEGDITHLYDNERHFKDHHFKQVHYLQILTWDFEGKLFKHVENSLTYYQSRGKTYWYDDATKCLNSTSIIIGFNLSYFVDVNENKIEEETMSNEMPKLEAGKHVIKHAVCGYGLVLDGFVVYFDEGWDHIGSIQHKIIAIYDIEWGSNFMSTGLYKNAKPIWTRDDPKKIDLKEEYSQIQKQMKELQSKMDEIEGKL